MNTENDKDIDQILEDDDRIEAALRQAVREALLRHKQAGNPVVECDNGKIVILPAEDIVIPEESS